MGSRALPLIPCRLGILFREPSTHPTSMFVRRLIQSEATDFAALMKRCPVPIHITVNERRWPLLLQIMRPAVVLRERKVIAVYLPKDAFAAAARKRKAMASNPFPTVSFQGAQRTLR